MALPHAASGQCIRLQRGDDEIAHFTSVALAKTAHMALMRLVLPKGRVMPEHKTDGEMTLLCLSGEIELHAGGLITRLCPTEMLWLAGGAPHAVRAVEDAIALMTILLEPAENTDILRGARRNYMPEASILDGLD